MAVHIIGQDIKILRKFYDEALEMQGIPCKYQYPHLATTNVQGEPVIDSYSEYIDAHVFFDGTPKVRTYKRYGWVVENDANLPFLIHCSFNLPHVQRDSLFTLGGLYAEVGDRIFRVTEITEDLVAPDHIVCQVVPHYGSSQTVGRTDKEIASQFNQSNYFLKSNFDYNGRAYMTREDGDDR